MTSLAVPVAVAAPPTGAARRGRPTPERLAEIEAGIRDAALEVFLEAGFAAATMEAVAQRAQVSKGTLYARYDCKERLFRAVIEDEISRWSVRSGAGDHLLPTELGPRLRQLARGLIEVHEWPEYRRLSDLIQGALVVMPSLALDWEEVGSGRYLQFLAGDMATTCPGVSADWDYLARLFFFSISGWQRHAIALGRAAPQEVTAFADRTVALIEDAVREAAAL